VQLVSNALFSSWEPNNENLTLNPTLDFKGNIESRPLAPQPTPQRNIPWSTQDVTFFSKHQASFLVIPTLLTTWMKAHPKSIGCF